MEHGFSTPEKASNRNYNVFGDKSVPKPSGGSEKGFSSPMVLKEPFPSPPSASRLPVFGNLFPKKHNVAILETTPRRAHPRLPSDVTDVVEEGKGDLETSPRVVQHKRKLTGDTLNTPTKIRTTTTTPGAPRKKLRPSQPLFSASASSSDVNTKCPPILVLWLCFCLFQNVAAPKQ